jgi:hypothetical protein
VRARRLRSDTEWGRADHSGAASALETASAPAGRSEGACPRSAAAAAAAASDREGAATPAASDREGAATPAASDREGAAAAREDGAATATAAALKRLRLRSASLRGEGISPVASNCPASSRRCAGNPRSRRSNPHRKPEENLRWLRKVVRETDAVIGGLDGVSCDSE